MSKPSSTASTTWLIWVVFLVLLALLALLGQRVSVERPVPLARLGRRVIEGRQVPMVSGVLLALLVLQARVVLMDLPVLSDQRATLVLPVPRGGLGHKARLDRRVIVENVVLLVIVERLVLLALLVLQARVVLMDLPVLSDQRATLVLPVPRGGLGHKARLDRRVIVENVVLLVIVERLVLLALPVRRVNVDKLVPLVRERITSGPSR